MENNETNMEIQKMETELEKMAAEEYPTTYEIETEAAHPDNEKKSVFPGIALVVGGVALVGAGIHYGRKLGRKMVRRYVERHAEDFEDMYIDVDGNPYTKMPVLDPEEEHDMDVVEFPGKDETEE